MCFQRSRPRCFERTLCTPPSFNSGTYIRPVLTLDQLLRLSNLTYPTLDTIYRYFSVFSVRAPRNWGRRSAYPPRQVRRALAKILGRLLCRLRRMLPTALLLSINRFRVTAPRLAYVCRAHKAACVPTRFAWQSVICSCRRRNWDGTGLIAKCKADNELGNFRSPQAFSCRARCTLHTAWLLFGVSRIACAILTGINNRERKGRPMKPARNTSGKSNGGHLNNFCSAWGSLRQYKRNSFTQGRKEIKPSVNTRDDPGTTLFVPYTFSLLFVFRITSSCSRRLFPFHFPPTE